MISIKVLEVKSFMAKLLINTIFDQFILRELDISTFTNFHVNGQLNSSFFSGDELEERQEKNNLLWSDVRNIALSIIKGNKTPLSFKVVFQLPSSQVEELIKGMAGRLRIDEVGGLYMNVRYEKNELHIITGTAIKTFTMDKTLEQEWDSMAKRFLTEQGIVYEEDQ